MTPSDRFDLYDIEFRSLGQEKSRRTVFYFALSAHDTLTIPSINMGAQYLASHGVQVISPTLIFHEENEKPKDIQNLWSHEILAYERHQNRLLEAISKLARESEHVGFMGLSRGGFVASHLFAKLPNIKALTAFAPLTFLRNQDPWNVSLLDFHSRPARFYVGHRDTLVHTAQVMDAHASIVDRDAVARKTSSFDLVVKPSIGMQGHGTSPATFLEGAQWLLENL
ncbi:MAG: hypothetical protein A3F09_00455 [Chlamydiae bacterium RIFCSPHIGHO2_12_FULL_49_11]|nr:MAG: hypothetical protein A3F09_00455 [Chlamydiae bacterium RIFCSPHIGHO2_12_FULL_49_11]